MTLTLPRHSELRAKLDQAADAVPGTISGLAAPLDTPIVQGPIRHILRPGVFSRQFRDPARVKILGQHITWSNPIGALTELGERDAAIVFAGRIIDSPKIPAAQETLELIREGVLDEVSIGFDWGKWTEEWADDGTVTITHTKAQLLELSVVSWGAAGRAARIKTAAGERRPTVAEWRAVLGSMC